MRPMRPTGLSSLHIDHYDYLASALHSLQLFRAPTLPARTRSYLTKRTYISTTPRLSSNSFRTGPSPVRLPKEEQEIFEELQRRSTGAFSTPREAPKINQSPHTTVNATRPQINQSPHSVNQSPDSTASGASEDGKTFQVNASGEGEELHPDVRRGAKPEFEGDVNPKTGEVGGPKNEPLRWGAVGDWSYNGRVTDF